MPARVTGIVFHDLNSNGILEVGDPRIPNTWLAIEAPSFVCLYQQTDASGVYTFSRITTPGDYMISETVINTGLCPAAVFFQPAGFTASTTVRTQTIRITQADIDHDRTITGRNYGHDNPALFACDPVGYTVVLPFGAVNSQLVEINLVTGAITMINPDLGRPINAIGYQTLDNLIYGIDPNTAEILRITADGTVTDLGVPHGLPVGVYSVGDMDNNGQYYLYRTHDAVFYVIDLNQNSTTFGQIKANIATPQPHITDWSLNPVDGMLYGVDGTTGNVIQVNPFTGAVVERATNGLPIPSSYPSSYMDAHGTLYVLSNDAGTIYRILMVGNTATAGLFSETGFIVQQSNGAFCKNQFVNVDFGDAPDTAIGTSNENYHTLLASNGARHQMVNELSFGTTATQQLDAFQTPTADGDDAITLPLVPIVTTDIIYSFDMIVKNNTGEKANLYAWIDLNRNGSFEGLEAAIPVVIPSNVAQRTVTVLFNMAVAPMEGTTFMRVRMTTDALINVNEGNLAFEDTRSFGPATDGAVQDYRIEVIAVCKEPPVILTPPVSLCVGMPYDQLNGIEAFDCDGSEIALTLNHVVANDVNTAISGQYSTTYLVPSLINTKASTQTRMGTVCTISPRYQAITDTFTSIALTEVALSHILNAEGEKIQKAVALDATIEEMLAMNQSVIAMTKRITALEIVLKGRSEIFDCSLCGDQCLDNG